jgi:hypothetical protein
MRLIFIFTIINLALSINVSRQSRVITGRVITEDLNLQPYVRIQNSDNVLLGTTDIDGKFNIAVPFETKTLIFNWIGMEWTFINLNDSCDHLEIIMMSDEIYDYMSIRKVDRLRAIRFNKLHDLHQSAFLNGIFKLEKPCYHQDFISSKEMSKRIKNIKQTKMPST